LGLELSNVHSESGDVTIVFDEHRHAEDFLELLFQRHIGPALEVGGKNNSPRIEIDGPGSPDPDAGNLFKGEVRFINRVLSGAGDALDDFVDPPLRFGAELGGANAL